MYGNPTFDCGGAQIHAVCRQLATVVTVDGVVDDTNIDPVTALARRFVLTEKPFVLDLSGVTSLPAQCVSLLYDIDESCYHADVEWSVVASEPALRVLRTSGVDFPICESVPDALHHFAETIEQRRRLLPLLTKKSA
ncbi:STAS domain-containing protein [Mycobacterium sp. IDR2000157661]|uniref:STAS domain-containing protein n=1 Tax=Mycobacterium sp. IDR2000157661 TaxID=2867005 RepID=UPI001EE9D5CA|nr:STAS domain-containing protein [Mycobacterium sp. IDR2000157661]ULE34421.1 anti-anti-sigma factor [Mycobacterium sp. IDR2000157661]